MTLGLGPRLAVEIPDLIQNELIVHKKAFTSTTSGAIASNNN